MAEIKEPPKHMFLKLLGSMKSLTVVLVQRDTELAVAQASDFLLQLQMSDHVKKVLYPGLLEFVLLDSYSAS